jgi:hypothetical protein
LKLRLGLVDCSTWATSNSGVLVGSTKTTDLGE